MKHLVFTFLALLALTACDTPAKPGKEVLMGDWQADFAESWNISRDAFMKDTLRGAAAYPKDPVEREEAIRKETEEIVKPMTLMFAADGKASMTILGRARQATYTIDAGENGDVAVKLKVGKANEYKIEFMTRDRLHMTHTRDGAPAIVFSRVQDE